MDFAWKSEWIEPNKSLALRWIKVKLTELQNEPPEDLFLEYISTMICNHKTMKDIGIDLKDFIGEDKANEFADGLGIYLRQVETAASQGAAQSEVSEPQKSSVAVSSASASGLSKTRSVVKVDDKVLEGALKSSRRGDGSDSTRQSQNARLLQTAIRSSVSADAGASKSKVPVTARLGGEATDKKRKGEGNDEVPDSKRGPNPGVTLHDDSRMSSRAAPGRSIASRVSGNPADVSHRPPVPPTPAPMPFSMPMSMPMGGGPLPPPGSPVGYDQINMMARMFGFGSAEEMIRTQQQMMVQIATTGMMPGVPPPAMGDAHSRGGFGGYPSYPHHATPYGGGRGPAHFNAKRGGRGGGRFNGQDRPPLPSAPPAAQSSSAPPSSSASASDTVTPVPAAIEGTQATAAPSSDAPPSHFQPGFSTRGRGRGGGRGYNAGRFTDPAAAASAWHAGGRGSFRGGRGRGRGGPPAAPVANKTWVREADISSSLISGR